MALLGLLWFYLTKMSQSMGMTKIILAGKMSLLAQKQLPLIYLIGRLLLHEKMNLYYWENWQTLMSRIQMRKNGFKFEQYQEIYIYMNAYGHVIPITITESIMMVYFSKPMAQELRT